MGVAGLHNKLKTLLRDYKILRSQFPGHVSILCLDLNAVLHPVAQMVYSYGENADPRRTKEMVLGMSAEVLFNDFYDTLFTTIARIMDSCKPKDLLIVGVDGPVPMGKITQQRQRRFVSATMVKGGQAGTGVEDQPKIVGSIDPYSASTFDPSALTPGTEFMVNLHEKLQKWLQDGIDVAAAGFPPKILYSGQYVFGEAEHKIMNILRDPDTFVMRDGSRMTGHTVIHGNDADLMLLGLILPLNKLINAKSVQYRPNDYQIRQMKNEARNNNRTAKFQLMKLDASKSKTLTRMEYVDIDAMRIGVAKLMNHNKFNNDAHHDFVAMMTLLGNDFIPSLFGFRDMMEAINLMIRSYNKLRLPLTTTSETRGVRTYHWPNFHMFLRKLAQTESDMLTGIALKQLSNRPYNYPSTMISASTTIIDDIDGERKTVVNQEIFRNLWYNNSLMPRSEANAISVVSPAVDDVKAMCLEYFTTLAWIYLYYQDSLAVSTAWAYRYFHAPLLVDLARSSMNMSQQKLLAHTYSEDDIKILPIYQLLSVLPLTSMHLLPKEAQKLMKTNSPLHYLYPSHFDYEIEAHMRHYEGTAIIPFANLVDVQAAVVSLGKMTNADKLTVYQVEIPADGIMERDRSRDEMHVARALQRQLLSNEAELQHQERVERGLAKGTYQAAHPTVPAQAAEPVREVIYRETKHTNFNSWTNQELM